VQQAPPRQAFPAAVVVVLVTAVVAAAALAAMLATAAQEAAATLEETVLLVAAVAAVAAVAEPVTVLIPEAVFLPQAALAAAQGYRGKDQTARVAHGLVTASKAVPLGVAEAGVTALRSVAAAAAQTLASAAIRGKVAVSALFGPAHLGHSRPPILEICNGKRSLYPNSRRLALRAPYFR
jgi:hypothetical protein